MYRLSLFGGVSVQGPSGPLTGRIVQRRQLNVGFDAGQGFVSEQRGSEELFAAMHDAMADAVQVAARGGETDLTDEDVLTGSDADPADDGEDF